MSKIEITHWQLNMIKPNYARVTTVIKETESEEKKQKLIRWQKVQEKKYGVEGANQRMNEIRNKGTALHSAIESFLEKPDWKNGVSEDSPLFPYFFKLRPYFHVFINSGLCLMEQRLYSKTMGVTGQFDLLTKNSENLLTIVDWTRSEGYKRREWVEHKFIQAGAYSLLIKENWSMEVQNLMVVVFEDYQTKTKTVKKVKLFEESPEKYQQEFMERVKKYYG